MSRKARKITLNNPKPKKLQPRIRRLRIQPELTLVSRKARKINLNNPKNCKGLSDIDKNQFKSEVAKMLMFAALQHRETLRDALLAGNPTPFKEIGYDAAIGSEFGDFFNRLKDAFKGPLRLADMSGELNEFIEGFWDPDTVAQASTDDEDCPPDWVLKAALIGALEAVERACKTGDPSTPSVGKQAV